MLANVVNQLDARSSGLPKFWWAIFILVDLIKIMLGYFYSGGLSLFWWAVYIFWWVILILVGHLYSGELILFCWAVLFS